MLKKAVPNLKRWVSGYLVAVMTLMLVFNNSFAFSALAAETASGSNAEKEASASDAFKNSKVSLKNSQKEDVQFLIFSEQSSYEPGETVCLDLYIKNNTDKTITDGLLKIARAKGIEEDSAYFEDMTDLYEAANREEEKPEETTAEETKAEETEEGTSAEEKEELTAESSEEIGLESAETPEITEAAENVEDLLPTESEPEMRGDENIGMEIAGNEVEETVEEGSVAFEDETNKEDEEETDEEEKEEEPDRLSELEILPGKTAYINFYYTIDPEIEGMKDQDIRFSFDWTQENKDGKEEKHNKKEEFCYSVDALNLLTVTTGGEKGWVEVGKEDEMLLEFDLGQMREILDEAVEEELEKHEDDDASASEARRASASETLVGWDEENGSRPLGKKDPAMIKKLKCEVETFGLKLNKFKAAPVTDDDNYGTSLKCDFLVSRNNVPGTYYGRVKASYEIKNRTFHTTQGFKVVVKQETGEIELTGKIGDSEIIMSGPASAFPAGDDLALKVSEVTPEQQEKVDEALQKKAEEDGTEIKQYRALDIKLIVDGKEIEPDGKFQVRFKNVELEKIDEEKEEQEKPEEQSIVKRAMRRVMSLFTARNEENENVAAVTEAEETAEVADADTEENEKADSEKEDKEKEETVESSENIKVFHLDEQAVSVTDMKANAQDNGDVVINTDHFSIYILVDMETLVGSINLTVQHWSNINVLDGVEGEDGLQDKGEYAELNRISSFVEIYSDDTLVLDNQLKRKIEDLSKICIDNSRKEIKNYELSELWISKNGDKESTTKTDWDCYKLNSSDDITVTLKKDTVIRMIYNPISKEEAFKNDVIFYDYNITDGNNITEKGNVTTKNQGINTDSNYEGKGTNSNRIAVGQTTAAIDHPYGDAKIGNFKLNGGNGKGIAATGMVKMGSLDNPAVDDDGPVYNNVYDAGLFNKKPKTGKKIYDGFKLSFNQVGDTYTLTKVYDEEKAVLENLETFDFIGISPWGEHPKLFSNNFWPLDKTEYYQGKDPMFGKRSNGTHGYHTTENGNMGVSDDGKSHNWYFGMRYDFEFTLGDYTGPLKYYFRGDDDFWLFVDGVLKADIGGIHSSIGRTIDLSNFIKEQDKNKTHLLTIIYAERGGAGSTCYMEFTLPNVKPVIFETKNRMSIKIQKIWDDNHNPYRDPVAVKLWYAKDGTNDWIEYEQTFTLSSANVSPNSPDIWETELSGFPATGYKYKVEEINIQNGYSVSYSVGGGDWSSNVPELGKDPTVKIKNTLTPKVTVKVEKIWDDTKDIESNRAEEVYVQLQYKKMNDEEYINYPSNATGRLILNGEADSSLDKKAREYEGWKGIFEDLPYYIDGEPVTYRVRELKKENTGKNEKFTILSDGDTLSGKDKAWNYTVHYEDFLFPDITEIFENIGEELPISKEKMKKIKLYERKEDGTYIYKTSEDSIDKEDGKIELKYALASKNAKYTLKYSGKTWQIKFECIAKPENPNNAAINNSTTDEDKNKLYKITVTDNNNKNTEYFITKSTEETTNGKTTASINDKVVIESKIRNICPAKLTIKKEIVDKNGNCIEGEYELPNEPIDPKYKFMIRLWKANVEKDENGIITKIGDKVLYTTVALGNGATSAVIYLTPPVAGEEYFIEEIVPMEYRLQDVIVTKTNIYGKKTQDAEEAIKENLEGVDKDSKLKIANIKPGDTVEFIAKNTPNHNDYFHHTYSVTNKNQMNSSVTGNGFDKKDGYYDERDQHTTNETVPKKQAAVTTEYDYTIAYIGETANGKEKRMDWGDDLNAWT